MTDTARAFLENRYVVLPALVTEPQLSSLYRYGMKRLELAVTDWERRNPDPDAPLTRAAYADPMMDMLLARMTPAVERITCLKVFPTFSYFRVYQRGDSLRKHKDRPACEIALTLNAGYQADRPWPLWIEGPRGAVSIELAAGDAVLYRGMDCAHWRDTFHGDHIMGVFLFYVGQEGPHAEWRFDKRPALNSFMAR